MSAAPDSARPNKYVERGWKEYCLKEQKGVRKFVQESNGRGVASFACAEGASDECLFADLASTVQKCGSDPQKELKLFAATQARYVANSLVNTYTSPWLQESAARNGQFFTDPFSILASSADEPPLDDVNGARRVVNITGQSGIDEALTGLPERIRALGAQVQAEGVSVFTLPEDLGVSYSGKPFPYMSQGPSIEEKYFDSIPYRTYGDTGLNVYHVTPVSIPFNPSEEMPYNPALNSRPTVIDEYGTLERESSNFDPVPLLEGDEDSPLAEIPAFHPIKLDTQVMSQSLQTVRTGIGTLFGRFSGWLRDLWF